MEVIHDDLGLTHCWSDHCRHWVDYVAKAVVGKRDRYQRQSPNCNDHLLVFPRSR